MNTKIGLFFILGLILAGCSPVQPTPLAGAGIPLSTDEPAGAPVIVAIPTELGDEPLIQIIPTGLEIEGPTMSATQVQLPSDDEALEVVKLAKQDLAKRLGMQEDSITVSAVIGQDFSTNAFYCRESKDRIARDEDPAAISGWTILLKAAGHGYEYHAAGSSVVFCRLVR